MTVLPLLPAQRPKWAAWLAEPASGANGIGAMLRVHGPLDTVRLQAALDAVQAAQPVLRATFQAGGQVIHPATGVLLRRARTDDPRAARRLGSALAAEPFDLRTGPLLRALLVRISDDDHLLALALPSVAVDGWSMNLLITELERAYQDLSGGRAPRLPDQTAAYAAICERRSALDCQAGYREWIKGVPRLELPDDLPRPGTRSTRGAEVRLDLGPGAPAELAAASRRRRTSAFPLLFTAFAIVLAQRSGQDRFLVNVFVGGRSRPEEFHVVGRLANMVPMPVDLTPPDPVGAMTRMWWDSHDFHDVLVPEAAWAIEGEPPPGRLALSDLDFVLHFGEPALPADGVPKIVREREPTRYSLRDLTLFAGPTATGFELRLEYRPDLYREQTAWDILDDYRGVLAELTTEREDPGPAEPVTGRRDRSTP